MYRVSINSIAKIKKETHYKDLGNLAEFSMEKDMTFTYPKSLADNGGDQSHGIGGEMDGIPPLPHIAKEQWHKDACIKATNMADRLQRISSRQNSKKDLTTVAPEK